MPQDFASFSTLPLDIRRDVYSKMRLVERLQIVRASADAREYFMLNRADAVHVMVFVSHSNGVPSMNIEIDGIYEERHKLSAEMIERLRTELDSYVGCACEQCTSGGFRMNHFNSEFRPPSTVVDMDWQSIDNLFYVTQFLKVENMRIRTEPYGGLIESIQPTSSHLPVRTFGISWHQKDRNTRQRLELVKWNKWMEFFGSRNIILCLATRSRDYIDKEIFNCEEIRNAEHVYAEQTTVGMDQIRQLKAITLSLQIPSYCITQPEYFQFYREKLLGWIENPMLDYDLQIGLIDPVQREPHYCLVEELGETLQNGVQLGADFRLYMNWDCFFSGPGHRITVRHLTLIKDSSALLDYENSISRQLPVNCLPIVQQVTRKISKKKNNSKLYASTRYQRISSSQSPAIGGECQRADDKIMQTRRQLNEVMGLMRDNIHKVAERGEKLENLAERAEALEIGTQQFQRAAVEIRRKKFWKAYAMYIAVVATVGVMVLAGIGYNRIA